MLICGLSGGIGHGKTTFADLLAQHSSSAAHFETWELIAEVAMALRAENPIHPAPNDIDAINEWLLPLCDVIGLHIHCDINYNALKLTDERLAKHPENYEKLFQYLRTIQADPSLVNVDVNDDNKQLFRPLLQWLGGYLVVVGGGVWYAEIVRRIAHVRSTNIELVTIGGVRYPDDAEQLRNSGAVILEINRPDIATQDNQDLTERQRNLIEPDSLIINNGTLHNLKRCAGKVYYDAKLRQLQPTYSASA